MFHVGFGELAVIAVIALFVVGPDRLPKLASDAARMLRELRHMAHNATSSVREELGPDFADVRLEDLNPRTFVRRHLFEGLEDDLDPGLPPTSAAAHVTGGGTAPLAAGERPPYDADAT